VRFVFPIIVFAVVVGVFYSLIGRRTSQRDVLSVVLAFVAAVPLLSGAWLLMAEYARQQDGRVVSGVIVGKLSSTGESGSQTIGGNRQWRSRRLPSVLTPDGFHYDQVLARILLTGSPDAWVINYRYPCENGRACYHRDFVRHDLWSALQVGQPVNVRMTRDQSDSGRLDENLLWPTALVRLGIGAILALVAGLVSGRLIRRRPKYVMAPGVVTAVEPIGTGGWRVRFAYFSDDGTAQESVDQVFVAGVKPGDDCTAVYSPARPDLGTLRLAERT